jgi:DNA anti-recombination protein RmuC
LRAETTWYKRLGRRLAFKTNVTATLLSLIAQHYYLTLSHGVKRSQTEPAVRAYVEKQLAVFAESQRGLRATLLKPFKPTLEKFARWLRKRYQQELKKQAAGSAPAKKTRR